MAILTCNTSHTTPPPPQEDHWTQSVPAPTECFPNSTTRMVDLYDTDAPAYALNGTDYGDGLFASRAHAIITDHSQNEPVAPLFLYYAFQVTWSNASPPVLCFTIHYLPTVAHSPSPPPPTP